MRDKGSRAAITRGRAPSGASLHPAVALQRRIGNHAFGQLVQRSCGCGCGGSKGGCGEADETDLPRVQRAKIAHRAVTWTDFEKTATGAYPAVTASDIAATPAKPTLATTAADTGETTGCTKKKTMWDATAGVDPAAFASVKGYMDTGKSAVTKAYRNGVPGVAPAVAECKKNFADLAGDAATAGKTAAAEQGKGCNDAFDSGNTSYKVTFGTTEIKADKKTECAALAKRVKELTTAGHYGTYSTTFTAGDAPEGCSYKPFITGKAEATLGTCDTTFRAALATLGAKESARLLAHEQVHFNISAAKGAALKTSLDAAATPMTASGKGCGEKAAKAAAVKAFTSVDRAPLTSATDKAKKDHAATQKAYDDATCHGLDQTNQDTWTSQYPTVTPPAASAAKDDEP